MQIKTVERKVKEKMLEWLDSIADLDLRKRVRGSLLVSGGCIASMLMSEEVNDYDVYITDQNVLKDLAKYYIKSVSGASIWDGRDKEGVKARVTEENHFDDEYLDTGCSKVCSSFRNLQPDQILIWLRDSDMSGAVTLAPDPKLKYQPVHISQNAISLTDDVQIVTRFSGSPEQIHKNFDFVHATCYFSFQNGLIRNQMALESILTKQLRYQGSLYPVTSIIRAKKFVKRGFNISAGEYMKMAFQCSQLDLSNIDVLQEQTTSIDCAYFSILIEALRTKMEKDGTFKVTSEYINEILDRIFNEEGSNLA